MATLFSYSGTELDALVEARNYYGWILTHFAPYVGSKVVELGAGTGTFAAFLLGGTNVSELTLVEPADNLFPLLQKKFSADPRVKLVKGYLGDLPASPALDSVVLINVHEHVRDDVDLLLGAYQRLVPGGTILVFAPALAALYGTLDEAFEHCRRYTKSDLASKLQQAGFGVESIRYLNLPGVATWFLAARVFRRNTIGRTAVRFYDRWVVPCASRLERLREPPLGQSLLAVARKPAGQA